MFNKEKKMKKWEQTRSKGKVRFIIIYGIIKWLIIFLILYGMYNYNLTEYKIHFWKIGLTLLVFLIVGIYNGNELWKSSEQAYKDYYDS